MIQVKTSDLSGAALDWAVRYALTGKPPMDYVGARDNFSTCWNKGGPIIDQLTRRGFRIHGRKCRYTAYETSVNVDVNDHYAMSGPTILIAAMRCFVASKLGDVVDVPEELL